MTLDSFCLEDVRCFTGAQNVRIRPLTFLVGENSTGKSTVLGCMQAVADYMHGMGPEIDFNQHPYEMGSFREIVRKSRPLLESFKLGAAFRGRDGREAARYTVELGEREGGARADVKQVTWQVWDMCIVLRPLLEPMQPGGPRIRVVAAKSDLSFVLEATDPWFYRYQASPWMWRWSGPRDTDATAGDSFRVALAERLGGRKHFALHGLSPATSIAPIRSKPQRTYNPFADAPDAEGSEVPAELARLARKGGAKWNSLKVQLEQFGREAGLFSELVVRKLGKSGSDPFQLQVKARGPKANIKDVGYGVSQVLPILARLAHPERAALTLIQQPEVHLHPRGQAALSSILIGLLDSNGKRPKRPPHFMIETHSDYMIDRARIAVQRGQIKADDVSLVYLEPKSRGGVTVHNLRFDKIGNLIGAPSGYRDFFLKETDALLGFGEQ